jgi:hypothetical protein
VVALREVGKIGVSKTAECGGDITGFPVLPQSWVVELKPTPAA